MDFIKEYKRHSKRRSARILLSAFAILLLLFTVSQLTLKGESFRRTAQYFPQSPDRIPPFIFLLAFQFYPVSVTLTMWGIRALTSKVRLDRVKRELKQRHDLPEKLHYEYVSGHKIGRFTISEHYIFGAVPQNPVFADRSLVLRVEEVPDGVSLLLVMKGGKGKLLRTRQFEKYGLIEILCGPQPDIIGGFGQGEAGQIFEQFFGGAGHKTKKK